MSKPQRAVNIGDFVARFDALHPVHILLRPILTTEWVECEGGNKMAGIGVLVRDDVPDDRWTAILHILRRGLGNFNPIPQTRLRIYEKGKGGWHRV